MLRTSRANASLGSTRCRSGSSVTPFSAGVRGNSRSSSDWIDVPGRVRRSRATAEGHPREHGRTASRECPRHRPDGHGRRPRVGAGPGKRPAAQPLLAPPASSCRGRPILLVGGPTRSRWPHGIPSFRSTQTCPEARRGAAASPPRTACQIATEIAPPLDADFSLCPRTWAMQQMLRKLVTKTAAHRLSRSSPSPRPQPLPSGRLGLR